jgi:hypothetical protein
MCYKPFIFKIMNKTEIKKALKQLKRAEYLFIEAETEVGKLSQIIQPFFKQEIKICMSTDGAVITDDSGELAFVSVFLNGL